MISFRSIRVLLYLLLFQSFYCLSANKINHYIKIFKARELPSQKDLSKYLKTVKVMTSYCSQNLNNIDINLAFGIFLSNVNFKRIIKDKENVLPIIIKAKLKHIIVKNEELLNYFKNITIHDTNFVDRKYRQIYKLFTNVSIWVDRLEELVNKHQKYYTSYELQEIYPQWEYYLEDVDNVEKWTPTPKLSDFCLASLSLSTIDKRDVDSRCPIADPCYVMLNEGSNFGYALCHRMLLLLTTRLGCGCTVISTKVDKALMEKYCSMGYNEVEYIAINDYGIVDLMMEIICLCSLEGHAQFLRRDWLRRISYFQKPRGCFGTDVARSKAVKSFDRPGLSYRTRYQNSSHEVCNGHTTALALGTFSAAIRYIIQEYF